jgi:hypothetical protein
MGKPLAKRPIERRTRMEGNIKEDPKKPGYEKMTEDRGEWC